jgi:predicted Zn-dependent protease
MMTTKSRKLQIEEMLAEEPNDAFLRYGLAMEFASAGDTTEALNQFRILVAATPDYVAAYHQAGQILIRIGDPVQARQMLTTGIAEARRQGNQHAAEEMLGLLDTLA